MRKNDWDTNEMREYLGLQECGCPEMDITSKEACGKYLKFNAVNNVGLINCSFTLILCKVVLINYEICLQQ